MQEIWARLIAYNLTEAMINSTVMEKAKRKHSYKVNFVLQPIYAGSSSACPQRKTRLM